MGEGIFVQSPVKTNLRGDEQPWPTPPTTSPPSPPPPAPGAAPMTPWTLMEGLLGIGSKEPVSSGLRTRDIDYTQGDPDMMVRQEAEGRRSLAYEHRDFFELLREY